MKKAELKNLVNQIKEDNLLFNNSSDAEKRVIIAKDCILRIKLGQFQPRDTVFIDDDMIHRFQNESHGNSLQKIFNDSQFECEGCAKGGLFMSYVGRVNDFKADEFEYGNDINDNNHAKLLEIFSPEQLALIECAFEGIILLDVNLTEAQVNQAFAMHERFIDEEFEVDSESLLLAICENIISNEGTFKP